MTNDLGIHAPLPSRKDFRIGILGSGFIVNECRLVAYRKAGFNPVAIASRTRAQAEMVAQRHAIPKVYDTLEELLDDPSIEILDIAVPPSAQFALIKAACQRKTVKGILAQKPLGLSYAKAVEAVELCEAAGIKLAVNQSMRYDQSVRAAKTLLNNGTIGDPVFATINMHGIPHWNSWQADLGRLTLRSVSIHHLDCFRYWFGDPEGIYCSIRTDPRIKFPHTDGIASYIVEYARGLRCVGIDDTWTGPALEGCPSDVRIQWRIEGLNGLAMGNIGLGIAPYTSPSSIRYASKGDKDFHQPVWTESWLRDAFIGTMAQLLIAIEKNEEPQISGRDNLKTMALVDAAYVSAAQFRSIGLYEVEKRPSPPTPPKPAAKEPLAESEAKEIKGFFSRMMSRFAPEPISEPVNNFTPRAQQVLALSRKEAERFNHNFVGTEHLLLGMIKLGQGVAVNVLQKLGLDLETVRMEVEKQVGTGPDQKMIGNIPYTPRVKKVLALAAKEAKNLNHTYVGTEHILLGLLREGDGVAARVLKNLGVDIEQTRQEILKELDPNLEPSIHRETLRGSAKVPSTTGTSQGPAEAMSNFTPRACQVLALARKEADRFGHNFVGPEHLLIGLIGLGQGVAANELSRLGLVLDTVRIEVQKQLGTGPDPKHVGNIPYTPAIENVFARAAGWARKLNHTYVGTEHILLGLLDDDGGAAVVLRNLGSDPDRIRVEILRELGPNAGS